MSMSQQEMQAEDRAIGEAKSWVATQKPWVIMYLYGELRKDPGTNSPDFIFVASNGMEINIKGFIDIWASKLQDLSLVNGDPIPDVVDVIRAWAQAMSDEQLDRHLSTSEPKFYITKHTQVRCGITLIEEKERRLIAAERASREITDGWGGWS